MRSVRTVLWMVASCLWAGAGCQSMPAPFDDSPALEEIRGTWASEGEGGLQSRLQFGTAEGRWHGAWITVSQAGVDVVRFRYTFRPTDREDRFALDLRAFDRGPLRGREMAGLLEWIEPGRSFRLDFESGPEGQRPERPEAFSTDAEVFRRVAD